MKILLAKTRPFFARVEYEPQVFFKFLELDENNEYLLWAKDGDKVLKRFGKENFPSNLKVTECKDYYITNNCNEKKEFLEKWLAYNKPERFLHIQGDIKPFYRHGQEEKGFTYLTKEMNKETITNFVSTRNFIEPAYASYFFSKKLKTTQIIIDPQEAHICDNRYYFYHNDRIKASYIPFVEYAFFKDSENKTYVKNKNFTFGFTVLTDDRVKIYEEIKKLDKYAINFLVKYPKADIDTSVSRKIYADMIKESKYTLLIPSYEDTDFSSIRFWDALFKNCLPLIHETCKWEQAFVEYPEITDIIRRKLLVSTDDIAIVLDSATYDNVLNEIKTTNDWKKLQDVSWYKTMTKSFFENL